MVDDNLSLYGFLFKRYRWENRILVVLGDDDDFRSKQKMIFDGVLNGLLDRDIIIFGLGEDKPPYLEDESVDLVKFRDEFHLGRNDNVALIGKDGSLKGKWRNPVTADELFRLIDAMPMRKAEIRKKKDGG